MFAQRRTPRFTVAEYLDFELEHSERFEYMDGLILAMAGAQPRHNAITVNVISSLHQRLRGRCRVMGADQRIATADGVYTYPDASVVCGPLELSTHKGTGTVHNPCVLVEVLSPSTRDYDLGDKLEAYKSIPALRHVLLIETAEPYVRHVRRTAEGWETLEIRALTDVVDLMGVALPLSELYEDLPEV